MEISSSRTLQFPLDLERLIFQTLALIDRGAAVRLLCVSRSVHECIGTVLYRTISHFPFQETINAPSPNQYPSITWYHRHGKFIRHLLLSLSSDPVLPFINHCPDLEDIAIWGYPSDMGQILADMTVLKAGSSIPLVKISVNLKRLFFTAHRDCVAISTTTNTNTTHSETSTSPPPAPQSPKFTFPPPLGLHPILRNITHLELLNRCECDEWDPYSGLSSLPSLTHLTTSKWTPRPFVVGVLRWCRVLRVLILLEPFHESEIEVEVDDSEVEDGIADGGGGVNDRLTQSCRVLDEQIDEVRKKYGTIGEEVVPGVERVIPIGAVYSVDWVNGANGLMSMWTLADRVVDRQVQVQEMEMEMEKAGAKARARAGEGRV